MRRKSTLLVIHTPDRVCQEEKALAVELEIHFNKRFSDLLRREPKACLVVAFVGCNPEVLAETEWCAFERRVFAFCFARCPDLIIEALQFVRQRASTRAQECLGRQQKNHQTQAGRVREFLLNTPSVAKKNGRFIEVADLKIGDYQPDHQTLRSGIKIVETAQLADGEIAQHLSEPDFKVSTESVKKVRQSLSSKGKN